MYRDRYFENNQQWKHMTRHSMELDQDSPLGRWEKVFAV